MKTEAEIRDAALLIVEFLRHDPYRIALSKSHMIGLVAALEWVMGEPYHPGDAEAQAKNREYIPELLRRIRVFLTENRVDHNSARPG